jgi:isoleucyl-tRNA synthetase
MAGPPRRAQYRPVPAQLDLPALDHAILDFWRDHSVFERSLEQSQGRPEWVFYEGPPTANGMPGAHHIEARVFKDVFPRYRTMKGHFVARKAGWDCHGLPVELAVEKELGFSGKQDIEAYGIAEFNAKCRESVTRHTDAFEALTRRMGYWVDLDDPYWTMNADYIESVWWSLKLIFDKGLLVEDFRVAPWCPRCETSLSTTSWPKAPRRWWTLRSSCGSRSRRGRWPGQHRCWCGPRRRGRWCPMWPSPCTPMSPTSSRPMAPRS